MTKIMTKIQQSRKNFESVDLVFLGAFICLVMLGLVMVTSASITMAERKMGQPFYFTIHQSAYLIIGIMCCMATRYTPLTWWFKFSKPIMMVTIVGLVLVLIPGLGRVVNGSSRWLSLGGVSLQISEFAKLGVIIYLASYIVRYDEAIKTQIKSVLHPLLLIGFICILLILEPDFGTTVVITMTSMGLLFLAGMPLWQFVVLGSILGVGFFGLAISAPYRLERLTAFLDPWADQYDTGYQLTQALIAFGRGEWFGVGLGSSVQKLFYLPEAHTDFVFAVLAEELGLVGAVLTILLYVALLWRGFSIGYFAEKRNEKFSAFICYGICLWIGLQTFINVGVNTGLLPTKGLTLPFISYGGNSLMVLCAAMGFLWNIDVHNRLDKKGAYYGKK
jgi:cell division protein FtsW